MRRLVPVLFAILLVPPAVAQVVDTTLQISTSQLSRAVPPDTPQPHSFILRLNYGPGLLTPTEVRFTMQVTDTPSWLRVLVQPPEFTVPIENPSPTGGVVQVEGNLTLVVAADASAFQEGEVGLLAEAEVSPPMGQPAPANETLVVRAGFRGTITAGPIPPVVGVQGGTTSWLEVPVTNTGNGPVIVVVSVLEEPFGTLHANPEDLRLDPGQQGVARVQLNTPWRESYEGNLTVRFEASHASAGTAGEAVELQTRLRNRSAVPIPFPVPLAAVAVALVALRGRRGSPP